jgi:cation:H+ antiporter
VVVAAVLGSVAYNATMTLGAAALARPLGITAASSLHLPLVLMLVAIAALVGLGRHGPLRRGAGAGLVAGYAAFVIVVAVFVSGGPR